MLIVYGAAIYLERREHGEPIVTDLASLPYKTALVKLVLSDSSSLSWDPVVLRYHCRWSLEWCQLFCRDRVHFLSGDSIMFGASGWKILKFIKNGNSLGFGQIFLLIGCHGVAFGVV